MNYTLFKELLKKRQKKFINQKSQPFDPLPQNIPHLTKQITIQSIIDKIIKNNCKTNLKLELNLEEKYTLIEHLSEKQNVSYNRNTLIQLMSIWRFPSTTYIHLPQINQIDENHPSQNHLSYCSFHNFFILYGQVQIFENQEHPTLHKLHPQNTIQQFPHQNILKEIVQPQQPTLLLEQNSSWGSIFQKKQSVSSNTILRITDSILIQLHPPKIQNMLFNSGGMDQDKKIKAIECFPTFGIISRRISSILPYFQLKKYSKNQFIYKIKQQPCAVHLILKGEILFEIKIQSPIQRDEQPSHKLSQQLSIQTQILGIFNYFGQQQIINKSTRKLNAICRSVQCQLLQIPIDKFQKLLNYHDFYNQIQISSQIKSNKRKQKINKSLEINLQFKKNTDKSKYDKSQLLPQHLKLKINSKKSGIRKRSLQPLHIMHGNIIKKIPTSRYCQPVNFSMLHADPDMYEATLKKFRKYSIQMPQKSKPEVNWDLKRVWKVLNLQTILREDTQINCPQARHFYQTHLRLQNHVQENKSFRPKTSSSTYRTKLQYIAYLQQFNNY